jgi:hypothetical protein
VLLKQLVAFADEIPYCGTRPPGSPRRSPPVHALARQAVTGAVPFTGKNEPDPSPWSVELNASFWSAIMLCQVGERLEQLKGAPAELGGQVVGAANSLFEDQCGSVPIAVLIQQLLHPPHPRPPWLETITVATTNVELGVQMGGEFGKQLAGAAGVLIKATLPQRQLDAKK